MCIDVVVLPGGVLTVSTELDVASAPTLTAAPAPLLEHGGVISIALGGRPPPTPSTTDHAPAGHGEWHLPGRRHRQRPRPPTGRDPRLFAMSLSPAPVRRPHRTPRPNHAPTRGGGRARTASISRLRGHARALGNRSIVRFTPPTSVPSRVALDPGMGQWQQSMFPMGCMGWMIATTPVSCEAAAETSAVETIAKVAAAMTRRRVRPARASSFMAHPRDDSDNDGTRRDVAQVATQVRGGAMHA